MFISRSKSKKKTKSLCGDFHPKNLLINVETSFKDALTKVNEGLLRLDKISLNELSLLNDIKSRLFDFDLLNQLYNQRPQKEFLKDQKENKMTESYIFQDLKSSFQDFMNTIAQIDQFRLFISNQNFPEEQNVFLRCLSSRLFNSEDLSLIHCSPSQNTLQSLNFANKQLSQEKVDEIKSILEYIMEDKQKMVINRSSQIKEFKQLQSIIGNKKLMIFQIYLENERVFLVVEYYQEGMKQYISDNTSHQNLKDILTFISKIMLKRQDFTKINVLQALIDIKQQLLNKSVLITKNILKEVLKDHIGSECELFEKDSEFFKNYFVDFKDSFSIKLEKENTVSIPIGLSNEVEFLTKIKNFNFDLISFQDSITRFWRFAIDSVSKYVQKEQLLRAVQQQHPNKFYFLFDDKKVLEQQSQQIPESFTTLQIPKLKDPLSNIEINDLEMSEDNFTTIKQLFNQFSGGDKNTFKFLRRFKTKKRVQKGTFFYSGESEKSQIFEIVVNRNQEGQILNYLLLVDNSKMEKPKIRRQQSSRTRAASEFNLQLKDSKFKPKTRSNSPQSPCHCKIAQDIMTRDKLNKACSTLLNYYNLTDFADTDDIMEIMKNKFRQHKVEELVEEKDLKQESYENTYLQVFFEQKQQKNDGSSPDSAEKQDENLIMSSNEQKNLCFDSPQISEGFSSGDKDLKLLSDWEFSSLNVKNSQEQCKLMWAIFNFSGTFDTFGININTEQFLKFIGAVQLKYDHNNNPFHNFKHAMTVTQSVFAFTRMGILDQYLNNLDKFICLLSALGHDIDHTGRTNPFEIAKQTKLAQRYNDETPLEMHHCAQLFKIMQNEQFKILDHMSDDDYKYCRKYIISNILYTDMKKHFQLLKDFEIKLQKLKEDNIPLIRSEHEESDKKLLCGMIVHSADLSSPCRQFEISKQWSVMISQEFTNQVNEEKELGIPVTSYLMGLEDMEVLSKQEINFIKVFIRPVWKIMAEFDEENLKPVLESCENNILEWEKVNEEEKKRKLEESKEEKKC